MYGLSATELHYLKEVFSKYSHIDRAILYGSRAMQTQRRGSDVDIVLVGKGLKKPLFDIYDELEEGLPYFVDIGLYDEITNEKLKAHIDRVGKVIYKKER